MWDLVDHKIIISWDAIFNENLMQRKEVEKSPEIEPLELEMCEDENEAFD